MAEIITDKPLSKSLRLSFFFWMTAVMSGLIFGGFGLTYWQPMATSSLAPLPPIVHIHGFLFSGWMLLLMVQAFLVNVNNVKLHRSLGTFGISMGTLLWIIAGDRFALPAYKIIKIGVGRKKVRRTDLRQCRKNEAMSGII